MDLGLQGKAALVAASSRGLGRAIAAELATEGARVMLSGRTEETLSQVATEMMEDTGSEVLYRVADLARGGDVRDLVNSTVEQFGGGGPSDQQLRGTARRGVSTTSRTKTGKTRSG